MYKEVKIAWEFFESLLITFLDLTMVIVLSQKSILKKNRLVEKTIKMHKLFSFNRKWSHKNL